MPLLCQGSASEDDELGGDEGFQRALNVSEFRTGPLRRAAVHRNPLVGRDKSLPGSVFELLPNCGSAPCNEESASTLMWR